MDPDQAADRPSKPPSVPAIQALRALAVLCVAAGHVRGAFLAVGLDRVADIDALQVGVDVFFVVSGFVMLYVERDRGAAAAKAFLARRVVRVVPLYWIFTALAALAALHGARDDPDRLRVLWRSLASFLFWPQPGEAADQPFAVPIYPVGWTLNCEAFFYAVFAALMAVGPPSRLLAGAAVLGGLVVLGQLVPLPSPWWFWTRPYLAEFLAGMGVAAALRRGWRLGPAAGGALAAAAVALFLAGSAFPERLVDWLGDYLDDMRALVWGLPSALFAAAAVLTPWTPRGGLARAVLFLGDASYSIYLTHFGFFTLATPVLHRLTGSHPGGLKLAAAWLALLLAGVLAGCGVYLAVERPLYRRMRRRVTSPRRVPAPDRGAG